MKHEEKPVRLGVVGEEVVAEPVVPARRLRLPRDG